MSAIEADTSPRTGEVPAPRTPDLEQRVSHVLEDIATDARRDPARYAKEAEVPEGGE